MTTPNEPFLRTLPEYRRAKQEAQESTRALERIVDRLEAQLNRPLECGKRASCCTNASRIALGSSASAARRALRSA